MGNTIYNKEKRVCALDWKQYKKPKQAAKIKGYKMFCGLVNYLSMFCLV